MLSVVILEVALSAATTGPGQPGAGRLGPQPPFGQPQPNTGELVVKATITRTCLGPSGQSAVPTALHVLLPIQNLSILIAEAPPGKGSTVIMTNSSGIAQSKMPVGAYSISVADLKVNRSLTLSVTASSEVIVNLTSQENWTESSFLAFTSAAVAGQPLPWTNVTAVFPRFTNVSSGGHAALILGTQPSCSEVLAHPSGSYETTVGLLDAQRGSGGVRVTFAAPASAKSGFDTLTLVTYTSEYGVGSGNV
jgi:hypothetical protein